MLYAGTGKGDRAAWALGGALASYGIGKAVKWGGAKLVDRFSKGKTVLGHFPEYLEVADELAAHRFDIPMETWTKMSQAERWAANQAFLDKMIARGDEFIFATHPLKTKPGSTFEREIKYMLEKGYRLGDDGWKLLPPSPGK